MFDPNKPFTVESTSSSEKGGFDPNAPFELYTPSRMARAGDWLKNAYATAGKPNEGPYKFSDPFGGGKPYVPSQEELNAKPPVARKAQAEPSLDETVRRQLPKAPLVGPRANVPLPNTRPVDVEYDIANKKSKYDANRPEAPQSPEGGLMTDTSGAIRTGGRNLDKLIGSQTGMLTAEESQADKAARVQGAQEKLQQTRDMASTISEAERQHLRQYRDADGVPFIDKLAQIEQLRKAAELRGDIQEFKAFDAAARALMARSDIGFRNELTQAKLGVSDTDIAKRQVTGDLDALIKSQMAPAATQTWARSAAETFPKAIADITADTITGALRIALSPVSLLEAVTGNKDAPISKILNKQGRELHKALSGGFTPDPAQAEDLGQKVVAGVASTGYFAATGGIGRFLGMSPVLATAITGALPQAEQQWQEAERAALRDPSLNQEWRKWVSFANGLGTGASEALPIGKMFERLEHISGGGLTRWLGALAASGGEEALQEGLQQLMQNANAVYLLQDPNATLTKDVVDSMLVGALSGAIVTGSGMAAKGGLDAFRKIYPSREETPPELKEILYPTNIGTAQPQAQFGQLPYQQANVTVGQQQAPSVTPPAGVEAQGVVTPPSPAAPQITVDEAGILKALGYPISMVREMGRAFIDATLEEARANNVRPDALTQEEMAAILPQTTAPAPVQPVQVSPGEQAQAALESGVNPLTALFGIGSAQARTGVGTSTAPQVTLPPELTPPPPAPAVEQQEPQQIISPEVMGEAKKRLAARIETLINEGMPLNDATFQAIAEVKEGTAPWIRGEQEVAPVVEAPVEQAVAEAPAEQAIAEAPVQEVVAEQPMAEEPIINVKAPRKQNRASNTLIGFIRNLGGINHPDFKELQIVGAYSKNGVSPDVAYRAASEAGYYFGEEPINMASVLWQDLKNKKTMKVKQEKLDPVELERLQEEAAENAITDAANQKALDFLVAKEGLEISPEIAEQAIIYARDPDTTIQQAIDLATFKENRRLGILTQEEEQSFIEEAGFAKPPTAQEARPERRETREQGARPQEEAGNEAAGEAAPSAVRVAPERDEQLESIFDEMLSGVGEKPAAKPVPTTVVSIKRKNDPLEGSITTVTLSNGAEYRLQNIDNDTFKAWYDIDTFRDNPGVPHLLMGFTREEAIAKILLIDAERKVSREEVIAQEAAKKSATYVSSVDAYFAQRRGELKPAAKPVEEKPAAKPKPSQAEIEQAAEQAQASINEFFGLPRDNSIESQLEQQIGEDTVLDTVDAPPAFNPAPMAVAEAQGILKKENLQVTQNADGTFAVTGKGTFGWKDTIKALGGAWDKASKSWRLKNDPTQSLGSAIAAANNGGSSEGSGGEDARSGGDVSKAEELQRLRDREDGRGDERVSDYTSLVGQQTKDLIANGLKFGVPQAVVDEQIEDVGMAVAAFSNGKPMFLLANEAGTGKTFVLGGIIRELSPKVPRIIYVTQSTDLIAQIKRDLASYGIGNVEFVTYAKMDADANGAILIFDEAHNVKNTESNRGSAASVMMGKAKMSIFASATPFQNPVEAGYIAATKMFDGVGGFDNWAKMYGASVRNIWIYSPSTGKKEKKEIIYWTGGPSKREDGAAARQWFIKQGVMTQRSMKIDPKMIDVQFNRQEVSQEYVNLYNKVIEAYEAAIGKFTHEDGSPVDAKIFGEISRHREGMIKRILEASKAQAAIKRAKEILADGKNVVIFVETKADRVIGRFKRSEHFKDNTLYTYPQMASMMNEWEQEMGMARMMGERGPSRPFAAFIVEIAHAMHSVGLDYELSSTADEITDALGGKEKVAIYTGDVTASAAFKNKQAFLSGEKKVIVATMAKGGTGLSLHDVVGNRPTVQLNINLPWAAWQVDQVAARVGRYGLQSKALVEWMFASNIPWETTKLAPRVGARMADMGAIVKGIDVKAAGKLLGDFDFEGVMDVKQVLGEGVIGEVREGDIYSEAERLEKARRLPADTSGGFFETPFPLAAFMTNVANIQPGTKVLEPSAGTGNLLRFLPNGAIAIAIEPRSDNVEALKKNMAGKSAHVVSTTFQEYEKDRMLRPVDAQPTFDTVLMNPPFERGPAGGWQDIGQVRAAYSMLAPNGRLISIMSEGPFFRQDGQSTEFRQFLDDVGATVVKMPEATFKKSGTLVNTRLVIIDKGALGGRTDVDISKAPFSVQTLRDLQTKMPPRLEGAGASPAKNLSILPSRRIDQIDTNEAGNLINGALGIIQRVAGNFADVRLVNLLSSEDVSLEEARRSGFRGTEQELTKAKGYAQKVNSSLVGVTLATFYSDSLSATAYHEADHVLEVLNLYSPEEKRAREVAIPRLRNFLLGNGYNKESVDQMDDMEVRAYANELYSLYVASGVKPDQIKIPDTMRRIYDKILRIVEGLRNWLSGNGYMNIEQVMESQYLGDIAKRAMADVASRMPMEEVSEAAKSYSFSEQTRNKIEALNAQTGAPVKAGRPSASFAAPAYGLADSISRKFSDRMGYQRQVQMAIEKFSGAPMVESLDAYLAADEMATRQSARLEKLRKQEIEPLINDIKKEGLTSDEVGEYLLAKHAQERNAYTLSIDAVFVRMQQIVRNPTISKQTKDMLRQQAMAMPDPVQQKIALAALKNVSTPTEKLRAQNRIDKMKIENRRSGITTPAAKIILDDFAKAGKTAALERIASKVYDMRDADLQRRIAGGLLDQDTVDGWNNRYSYYVNLSGFAELDGDEAPMGTGKGFSITKLESQATKGRTTLSANPLINTIMAAENGVIRIEKNRVTNTLLRMITANPNPELWTVNKVKMKKIIGYDGLVKSVRDTDMQFGDNVVITKVGGVPYYIQLNNPRLAEEWKNLGSQVMAPLVKYAIDLTGFYSSLATSKNPVFAMTNAYRDLGEATFFTFTEDKKLGALFLKNFMPALVASVRVTAGLETPQQAGVYDAWNMSGGKISRESRKDVQQLAEEIEDILKGIDPLTLKNSPAKTLVLLKKSFKQLEKISEPLENATRMAVYMAAIEAGYSQKKAASFSREATANFGRRGIWTPYAGLIFLFFGANVAGTVGVMRRVATNKTARAAYFSLIPLGFLMTMLNLAISDDDPIEKWKKNYSHIPDHVRSDNIIFKYGKGEKDFVKFPLPFGLKAPYYAGEQMAMAMMGQISGSKAAGNTLANIVSAYSPLGHGGIIGAITPWFLLPIYELENNKKYFSGAPITPTEKQGVPRSEQYSTGTSQAAVMVARAINEISGGSSVKPGTFDIFPGHIQYITEKLTSGVGQFAADIVGVGKSVYQGTEMKPERTPFVKTFAPVVTSEAQRYYEAKKVYDEKVNRARAAKNQMERDMKNPELRKEVRQVLKEAGATWSFNKGDPLSWISSPIQYVQKADKAITEINGKIKVIRESGLDARIKEQRIKVLTDKRDAEMSKARRRADPKLGAGAP